jgi:hypothetical protein
MPVSPKGPKKAGRSDVLKLLHDSDLVFTGTAVESKWVEQVVSGGSDLERPSSS